MPLQSVDVLSDDECQPSAGHGGLGAQAAASSSSRVARSVDALSDDEGPRPWSSEALARTAKRTGPALKLHINHRVQVGRLLQKPCSCAKRECMRQFAAAASSDELVDLRKTLVRLDKRDADMRVTGRTISNSHVG